MHTYTPVIKAKANDIAALSFLSAGAKLGTKPLIEAAVSIDGFNVGAKVTEAIAVIGAKMPAMDFYFDPLGLCSSGEQVKAFDSLSFTTKRFTPTIGLGRGRIAIDQLRSLIQRQGCGLAVRLEYEDLEDSAEDSWATILQLSSDLDLDPGRVDLIIDFRQISMLDILALQEQTLDFLALQPRGVGLGELTVIASSALDSVSSVTKNGTSNVHRRELTLWAALQFELGGTRGLRFGDYGIVNPDFVFSGPNPNANAKIRYTHGSNIVYFRGEGLYNPSRFGQYHDLSRRVMNSGVFLGSEFSYGDREIELCAGRDCNPGNLASWIRIDMNHHIEYTAKQTRNLASSIQRIDQPERLVELIAES